MFVDGSVVRLTSKFMAVSLVRLITNTALRIGGGGRCHYLFYNMASWRRAAFIWPLTTNMALLAEG